MSPMSQQTIAIKQARSPTDLINHLPEIIPESEAMFSLIMKILKKRGPAMAAGVMQICLDPNDTLWFTVHQYYRMKPIQSSVYVRGHINIKHLDVADDMIRAAECGAHPALGFEGQARKWVQQEEKRFGRGKVPAVRFQF